ncbi:BZ3500_MvSof-1268-A1-R1_Chr2-3g05344 [Microbotryum saponariae]|uniref:BZ3500_MvSof-1268-A1-R1_Chr2-3g05344 protein n=1 Tax=Microbotryum saponariae TaxID=289078 RepID=A0A2X0KBD4_9BASI|nr:BZ3500_MvSof-1268-A1-R1_Chr2-3g05344 [Microbotryum saponariae]SDA01237.1 BZ3501_MvSof-1269-A2-R1_Chr2-2g05017 [Microbotryum saponariae]
MPSSDQLERSQRSHSTAALATSFSPLSSESATVDVALAEVGAQPAQHHSVSASPEDESSLPSLTVAATGPRPPGSLAQQGRSKSMKTFTPSSRTHYSSRGFEADPFEHAGEHVVTTTTMTIDSSETSMYRSLSSFSSGALAAHEQGNWLERLGKRATTFGRWTTEHDHTLGEAGSREMGAPHDGEGTRRSPLQRRLGNDEDGDDSPDEGDGRQGLHISTSAANRYRPWGPTRNKSSLSVFHDPFENCEDHTLDFDYTSSRPTSPILSKPRSRPSSTPTSPSTRMSRLEPLPHLSKAMTRAQAEHEAELLGIDLDDPNVLAHQVLSAQDQLGVFSLVESVLEWPWSSSFDPKRATQHKNRSKDSSSFVDPRTSEPSTPPTTRSLPISRVTSHHSLSHLFDDHPSHQQNFPPSFTSTSTANAFKVGNLNSTRMTPLGNSDLSHLEPIDVLNEGAWSETGELTAYYRAKSSGNLEGLRWELEDPRLERYEVGKRLEKKVSGAGARLGGPVDAEAEAGNRKGGMGGESEGEGERTRTGIREGLGVLLDTIGLGSFV